MATRAWIQLVVLLILAVLAGFVLKGFFGGDGDGPVVTTTVTASPPVVTPSPSDDLPSPTPSPSPGVEDPDGEDPDGTGGDNGSGTGGSGTGGSGTGTAGSGSGTGGTVSGGGGTFSIGANITTELEPGVTAPINLTITNPHNRPLKLEDLTVAIKSLTAPNATTTYPCTLADYSVTQAVGEANLIVPANSTRSLQQLGLPQGQWPSLTMLDTASNQNGCKDTTIGLAYGGTAVWGDA